jgi:hypothetical protein
MATYHPEQGTGLFFLYKEEPDGEDGTGVEVVEGTIKVVLEDKRRDLKR